MRYDRGLNPGTTVAKMNLGGMTRDDAVARLRAHLGPFLASPVTLRFGDSSWTPTADVLGLRIDLDATLDRACRNGRDQGIVVRYGTLTRGDGESTLWG